MSIFGKIKDAIFGKKAQAAPVEAAPAAAPAATQAAPAPISEVDVEANLAAMAQGKDLNWRSSIVDLMCQSACKRDPLSARKRDPLSRWRKVDRTRAFALRAA